MAMQPKRKSPDAAGPRGRKPQPSRAVRLLMASAALIGRHPRALGGVVAFGVIFSFVAANALWYQPRRHPAPFLATRTADGVKTAPRGDGDPQATEPGVTVFRIERQSEEDLARAAEKAKPSELVRGIQQALAARGLYDGPADGLSGPKTEAAILFFEQTEGMDETGAPSAAILARLREVAAAPATDDNLRTASTRTAEVDEVAALIAAAEQPVAVVPAEKPVSPALVMKIQKALAGMAYANVKVDGIAGEATRAAIRAFEKSYRLPVTGEPSERVLKKLKSIGAI